MRKISPSLKTCSGLKDTLGDECGQSTLEAALILLIFISMCTALALLWHKADYQFAKLAQEAASHTLEGGLRGLQDIISF